MSGYKPCACRDCFETAIGVDGELALCDACAEASCDETGHGECQAEGAYGLDFCDGDYDSNYEDQP